MWHLIILNESSMAFVISSLVVNNLYPFSKTVAAETITPAEAVEQIDIG